jgi:hypothetical protein
LFIFLKPSFVHVTSPPNSKHGKQALRERQCPLSLAASRAASYVRMRTTAKHHAAGTVKHTVPYKDFCIFFINWRMATDIKLKDYIKYIYKYKERIKEKRTHYIKCY